MIDIKKLSMDEFIKLNKEMKSEYNRRKADYTYNLPVVTNKVNVYTLWYKYFIDHNRESFDNDGIKTLSVDKINSKEYMPASIQFHSYASKCDTQCKFENPSKFIENINKAKKYVDKRISMAIDDKYVAYKTKIKNGYKYMLYFTIEYIDRSYCDQPYKYNQIISIHKYYEKYDSGFGLFIEQHKAVNGFNKFELPSDDYICDKSEFDAELKKFYEQVDATISIL